MTGAAATTGGVERGTRGAGRGTRGAGRGTRPAGRGTRRSLAGLLTATGASVAANAMVAVLVPWLVLSRTGSPAQAGLVGAVGLAAARAGLAAVWHDRTLRAAALLGTVAMVFFAPLTLILTAHLAPRGEPAALGLVTAALGAGAVLGALAYGRVAGRVRRRPVLLGGLVVSAAGLALMALLPGTGLLAALALLTGAALGPLNPALATVVQTRTPAELRGRVVSTQWSLALVASPLGVLGAGLVLEWTGPGPALLVVAAGVLATAVLAAASRGLRCIEPHDLIRTEVPS